jgi:hypothetical protein
MRALRKPISSERRSVRIPVGSDRHPIDRHSEFCRSRSKTCDLRSARYLGHDSCFLKSRQGRVVSATAIAASCSRRSVEELFGEEIVLGLWPASGDVDPPGDGIPGSTG